MTPDIFHLADGFRAVVIGGAGGIGQPIAELFAAMGASVTATAATDGELERSRLTGRPGIATRVLDVTDDDAVDAFAGGVERLDALVNCAGILARDFEYERKTFRRVLEVNLVGTFSTCTAFRPALAAAKGCVVNIASMNAYRALPRIPAYCASKAGVVMLTKALAVAWAADGIRVNAVAPGFIETAINAEGRKDRVHYDRIAARTAFNRWGQPEEVAGTVVYLCTPAAAYVTGSVAAVDGGFLAT